MQKTKAIPKLLKWEFWPFWFFYLPVYFQIILYSIRARTLSFFTLVNPGMRMGGFSNYSKYDIIKQLNEKYLPKTLLFIKSTSAIELLKRMHESAIVFPIILKPDEGERGWKVEKINNELEMERYIADMPIPLLLQEFIALPEEYGVMYYRFPSEEKGNISSLMKRDFLSVTGNGTSTLVQLFHQSDRCVYHLEKLLLLFKKELQTILPSGEKKILVEIGNHNRGTTFLNGNELINDQLISAFDEAGKTLNEFYFGRFDVRCHSFYEMQNGNFKVLEVNGVNSEPAHIYDPNMHLLNAYRDLFHHWKTIFHISMENKKRGFLPMKMSDTYLMIREHLKQKSRHPNRL